MNFNKNLFKSQIQHGTGQPNYLDWLGDTEEKHGEITLPNTWSKNCQTKRPTRGKQPHDKSQAGLASYTSTTCSHY